MRGGWGGVGAGGGRGERFNTHLLLRLGRHSDPRRSRIVVHLGEKHQGVQLLALISLIFCLDVGLGLLRTGKKGGQGGLDWVGIFQGGTGSRGGTP